MVIKHTKNFAQLQVKPSAAVPDRRGGSASVSPHQQFTAATHIDSSWNFGALFRILQTLDSIHLNKHVQFPLLLFMSLSLPLY
jgi:hypothetical protein